MSTFVGKVDFGLITVRVDEFEAAVKRFKPLGSFDGKRHYLLSSLTTARGSQYLIALVRCLEQGQGVAQQVATDLIDDLDPQWLVLVGIAGAVPANEFTLGDVVLATRVHDFSVQAAKQGKQPEFDLRGGPIHPDVEDLLAQIPAMKKELQGWNSKKSIGMQIPYLELPPDIDSEKLYGSPDWRRQVRESLEHHFPSNQKLRRRLFWPGPLGTSNTLVKDADLVVLLQKAARSVVAVDMELGGVLIASRRKDHQYPVLAIRGISDVVGLKRDGNWTAYACHTAAAFAHALLRAGQVIEPRERHIEWANFYRADKQLAARVRRRIPPGFSLQRVYDNTPSEGYIDEMAWSLNGKELAIGTTSVATVIPVGGRVPIRTLESQTGALQGLAWSPDSKLLASGTAGGGIILWDVKAGREIGRLKSDTYWAICDVAWSPVSWTLMSAEGSDILLWDIVIDEWGNLKTAVPKRILRGHEKAIWRVVIAPDGSHCVSSSYDQTIRIWDLKTGTIERVLTTHSEYVRGLAWSRDGTIAYTANGMLHVWDGISPSSEIILTESARSGVGFSLDGKLLLALTDAGIQFWLTDSWRVHACLDEYATHMQSRAGVFGVRENYFAIGGFTMAPPAHNQVQIWSVDADVLRTSAAGQDTGGTPT